MIDLAATRKLYNFFREDESLAKCMYASITLLAEGRAGNDELCSKFLDNVLPEVGCEYWLSIKPIQFH